MKTKVYAIDILIDGKVIFCRHNPNDYQSTFPVKEYTPTYRSGKRLSKIANKYFVQVLFFNGQIGITIYNSHVYTK